MSVFVGNAKTTNDYIAVLYKDKWCTPNRLWHDSKSYRLESNIIRIYDKFCIKDIPKFVMLACLEIEIECV